MQVGNKTYLKESHFPANVPVFPLAGALLLPNGQMPLNIFEPRYLSMVDAALAGDRLIAMIQPDLDKVQLANGEPKLCEIGCLGRLTGFQESGDGRYQITLSGICRFRLQEEIVSSAPYRKYKIKPFLSDLEVEGEPSNVNRELLLKTFRDFLVANDLETDWEAINKASTDVLVNSLAMLSPYGPAEKQALLEAEDLKTRADTLIAITQIALARQSDDISSTLQ